MSSLASIILSYQRYDKIQAEIKPSVMLILNEDDVAMMMNHWPRGPDVHDCIKMVAKAWWRTGLQLCHWFVGSYSVSSLGHGAVGLHLHEYIIFHASSSRTGSLWNRYMNPSIIKLGKRIWTLERWEKHQQPSANAVFAPAYFSARISVPVCRDEIREMSAHTSYVDRKKIKRKRSRRSRRRRNKLYVNYLQSWF